MKRAERIRKRREAAKERQAHRDTLSPEEQLKELNNRSGASARERARLQRDVDMIEHMRKHKPNVHRYIEEQLPNDLKKQARKLERFV